MFSSISTNILTEIGRSTSTKLVMLVVLAVVANAISLMSLNLIFTRPLQTSHLRTSISNPAKPIAYSGILSPSSCYAFNTNLGSLMWYLAK